MNTEEPQYYVSLTEKGMHILRRWTFNILDSTTCAAEDCAFAKKLLSTINPASLTRRYQENDLVMGKSYCGRPFKYAGVTGTTISAEVDGTVLVRWNTQPEPTLHTAHVANLLLIQPAARYTYSIGPSFTTVADTSTTPPQIIATYRNTTPGSVQKAADLCQELNNIKH